MDRLRLSALEHRAHVLEDDVAAGTLCQAVGDLLADDLELPSLGTLEFRRPQLDRFDRDAALIEKRNALGLLGGRIARSRPTRVAGDLALLGWRLPLGRGEHLCERELLGILQHAQPLALGAEEIALEPLDPMLQGLDGGRQ